MNKIPNSNQLQTLEFSIFHKISKLIKLTNIYHEYNIIETKPNDQFQKKRIETSKTPIMNSSEKNQWNAWRHEIKCKRKGIKDLLAWREENLANISKENDKKLVMEPSQVGEREESLKSFEKVPLKKSNLTFKKTWFTSFDRSKNSFYRSKQTEILTKQFF